jgi:iron complex outermembrane receptor protein
MKMLTNVSSRRRLAGLISAGSAMSLVLSAPASAQDAPAASTEVAQPAGDVVGAPETDVAATTPAPGGDSDIVVTGSRIRGVAPVGSAVVAVGLEDIRNTTASNVTDVLKQVPQVFSTGVTDAAYQTTSGSGGSNLTRGAAINLRGINPSATLTLVDGQRITSSGVSAAFVDPNVIPTFALERIEIVADGASAIYGSDAVAGVVNIIPRKSVEGLEAHFRYTVADGYDKAQGMLMAGHGWETGRILVAGEYTHNNALETTERPFITQDLRALGGRDYRASTCNPGNIVIGGVSYAVPTGNPTTGSGLVSGTRNLCDVGYANIIPRTTRLNIFGNVEQQIGSALNLSL